MALVLRRLVFFHLDAVGVGIGVLANARHLPGNFHFRLVDADGELVVADLRSDDGMRTARSRSSKWCCRRAVAALPVRVSRAAYCIAYSTVAVMLLPDWQPGSPDAEFPYIYMGVPALTGMLRAPES